MSQNESKVDYALRGTLKGGKISAAELEHRCASVSYTHLDVYKRQQENLIQGRGDAYCGMLNASYNLALRNIGAYIPEYPVGDADDCEMCIRDRRWWK